MKESKPHEKVGIMNKVEPPLGGKRARMMENPPYLDHGQHIL
jgi:hypothetical protein